MHFPSTSMKPALHSTHDVLSSFKVLQLFFTGSSVGSWFRTGVNYGVDSGVEVGVGIV
jgi:hypothetical protein